VAGGDADEVVLLDLEKLDRPLRGARGGGRRPWAVHLSENGKMLGVQVGRAPGSRDPNARGAGDWTRFDLSRLKPTQDKGQAWAEAPATSGGWTVVPDPKDRFVWYAQRTRAGKTESLRLGLDRLRDQAPTCFAFLPASGARPTRLLVGHYYGCTLFELVPERAQKGALGGARVFTGHAGEVTSIAVAKEQTWFVTGGTDQTVAAWSLKDWKHEPNFGATFEERNGAVQVRAVDPGSPGWEAGLRAGDALDLLAVDAKLVLERRAKREPFGTAADALKALQAPEPRIELHFGIAAGKTARHGTVSTVRQRPVWKWFPAFDAQNRLNDWVVWMWHGSYYHTKSANGDRLVGWHVNAPDPGGRPEFYQLQQFEKRFHRPDILEQLVASGDVGAALVGARGPNPVREPFDQFEPAPIRVALQRLEVREDGLPLTISVRTRGTNPDLLPERVELWLNDYLAETWPPRGKALDPAQPFREALTLKADQFRTGDNRLTVVTFNAAGGRNEEVHVVRNARPAQDSRLLGVLAGVNDYSGARKNPAGARDFGDLGHARDDVAALGKELDKCAGPKLLFTEARVDRHLDPKRAKFAAGLTAFAELARPDDLLVVFFAGHGDLLMPKDAALPRAGHGLPTDGGTFLLCGPDYSPAKPGETALSAEELFAALAKVNCRKVVLLDACHSGRLATTSVLRRCVPNGQGPLIIAACAEGEECYEHPKYGHGLFTFAVLNALDKDKEYRKADFDTDGSLSAEELFGYISGKVPELLKGAGLKGHQNPVSFPRQLPTAPLLKR
ncbi:MAG TPA: caspase family protein, partial [Gemmata sp.]